MAFVSDGLVGCEEVALVFEEVVFVAGFGDVDQVVGDGLAVDGVVGEVFARAQVHAAVDLAGIGADDFGAETVGQGGGEGGLAGGGGA